MWTGGHNEVIPFTLKCAVLTVQMIPHFYRGISLSREMKESGEKLPPWVKRKMQHNVETFYPKRRLNINGDYVSYH